ncbi:MAG TPA: MerR family transcriptional regulator [Dermatophilaceae bacterium]|nr:MerR family transcriptional regulator [Dermatophilaceae bacterium]
MAETQPTTTVGNPLTVGQVAEMFAVTVRTLHHYDEIGLVRPSERSAAGYRLYTPADITVLQHVVVYRRLGFALEEIALLLDADGEELTRHLRRQRAAVGARLEEMADLVRAIDRALERQMTGVQLTKQEQRELFGDGFSEEYATEAEQRWGDTDAWKQSQQRTASYTKEQWVQIRDEGAANNAAFAQALAGGVPATSVQAMDLAEQARRHIDRWFYDCSPQLHVNLAEMYLADPRFTRTYEDVAPGLAQYVHDAIVANAARG